MRRRRAGRRRGRSDLVVFLSDPLDVEKALSICHYITLVGLA
jgi:hypothetical protein